MSKIKIQAALTMNILITLSTLLGMVMIFIVPLVTGDISLKATIAPLRFFTTDSNVFMGLISGMFVVLDSMLLSGRIREIPIFAYILKLAGSASVGLTLFTVLFYLAPLSPNGFFSVFMGSDLLFHFVVPVLSLIVFLFFEGNIKIKFRHTFWGIIPALLYGVAYSINAFSHAVNGVVPMEYDWYGFAQGGPLVAAMVFAGILLFSYLFSLLLWWVNRKTTRTMYTISIR